MATLPEAVRLLSMAMGRVAALAQRIPLPWPSFIAISIPLLRPAVCNRVSVWMRWTPGEGRGLPAVHVHVGRVLLHVVPQRISNRGIHGGVRRRPLAAKAVLLVLLVVLVLQILKVALVPLLALVRYVVMLLCEAPTGLGVPPL